MADVRDRLSAVIRTEAEVGNVTTFKASFDQISLRTFGDGIMSIPADPNSSAMAVTRVETVPSSSPK
jgi:hypothetical protein